MYTWDHFVSVYQRKKNKEEEKRTYYQRLRLGQYVNYLREYYFNNLYFFFEHSYIIHFARKYDRVIYNTAV